VTFLTDVTYQIHYMCDNPKYSHDLHIADIQQVPITTVTLVSARVHVAPVQVMYPQVHGSLEPWLSPVIMGCCLDKSHTYTGSVWSLDYAA
jgi:hypothetical protein